MVACLALLCSVHAYGEDKDRDRDHDRDAEKGSSVRLPGSKIVLSPGMSDEQVKGAFRAGAVALDGAAGTGLANVKAAFGDYIVTLSSVNHELKGFAVTVPASGDAKAADALRTWFESDVKRLKKPEHKSAPNASGKPVESWSTPDMEWAIWTVTDQPGNIPHPVYHITFTAAAVDDDD